MLLDVIAVVAIIVFLGSGLAIVLTDCFDTTPWRRETPIVQPPWEQDTVRTWPRPPLFDQEKE